MLPYCHLMVYISSSVLLVLWLTIITASITAALTSVNALLCNADVNTGSISVVAQLGNPPYSYSVSFIFFLPFLYLIVSYQIDGVNFGDSSLLSNLAPGTYTIVVADSNMCTYTLPPAAVLRPSGIIYLFIYLKLTQHLLIFQLQLCMVWLQHLLIKFVRIHQLAV